MTQFSCEAIASVEQLTVDNNAGAYTCTQGDFYEVVHALCHTIPFLAERSSVGIVGESYWNTELILEELCQRYDSLAPNQVGSVLYRSSIVVGARSSYSHCLDVLHATCFFYDSHHCLA